MFVNLDSKPMDFCLMSCWMDLISEVIECDDPNLAPQVLAFKKSAISSVANNTSSSSLYLYRFNVSVSNAVVFVLHNWACSNKELHRVFVKHLQHKAKTRALSFDELSELASHRLLLNRLSTIKRRLRQSVDGINAVKNNGDNND